MKQVKENLKSVATYASADTINAEGFAAWTPGDAALLEQLSMTGTLGNSFYANAKEAAKEAVQLLERADAASLAAAIVRGRNEGFIRTFPILGLVYLSKKDTAIFKETFGKVVLTGNDLNRYGSMLRIPLCCDGHTRCSLLSDGGFALPRRSVQSSRNVFDLRSFIASHHPATL